MCGKFRPGECSTARSLQYHVEHRRLFGTGLFSGGADKNDRTRQWRNGHLFEDFLGGFANEDYAEFAADDLDNHNFSGSLAMPFFLRNK